MPSSANQSARIQTITVGTRSSPLALVQVHEVLEEIHLYHPHIRFQVISMETSGDLDQKTSLKSIKDKTDFFTREIDQLQARGGCRISIHSAKDLPEPLHPDLTLAALTKGVDASDSLVIPEGETLESLPEGAYIATSSVRREEMVQALRSDLRFVDIRGSIQKRLEELDFGRIDGVVIAEAALIRLGLTHLNRIHLEGATVPLQGQLAILVHKEDEEMRELFSVLDSRLQS